MNAVELLIRLSGKTQKDFSEIVGIPGSNLSEMKKGKRDIPLSKFIEWCKLVDVDILEVFTEYKKYAQK